jgi:hypothetical protein
VKERKADRIALFFGYRQERRAAFWPPFTVQIYFLPVQVRMISAEARVPSVKTAVP